MKTVRDICEYIGGVVCRFPVCVETGCMYVCCPGNEVHTTTNNLLEFVCAPTHGRLVSVDIDPEHVEFARSFVAPVTTPSGGPDVCFEVGDSVQVLETLAQELREVGDSCPGPDGLPMLIDVLCLDSGEFDEDLMVREYAAIKGFLRPDKHFVLVDDIYNPSSVKHKKMVPLLKTLGYDYIEVPTPTGMLVAAKGYILPK